MTVADRTTRADAATVDATQASEIRGTACSNAAATATRSAPRTASRCSSTAMRTSTLRAALLRARHTVFIVGWDVDSRMRPRAWRPRRHAPRHARGVPARVTARRHNLRIYVLAWDFAMIYALERDWPPVYRAGWRTIAASCSGSTARIRAARPITRSWS